MSKKNLMLSYFLPQFHEVEENNVWWGKGFTEWTALEKWQPYYNEHSIRLPHEFLGKYSLLDKSALEKHALLARQYGLNGFIVWDYWFGGGKQLLEKPMKIVLDNKLDFPFCFAWANHSWYNKATNKLLQKQSYEGEHDYVEYFNRCLDYFKLDSYIKINEAPVFFIFDPKGLPSVKIFKDVFNEQAIKNGFPRIYFVGDNLSINDNEIEFFDAYLSVNEIMSARKYSHPLVYLREQMIKKFKCNNLGPLKYKYGCLLDKSSKVFNSDKKNVPVILSGWDTTPRHGKRGTVYEDFDVEYFKMLLNMAINSRDKDSDGLIVIKSWNEWAEGNVLEPDSINGFSLLDSIKRTRSVLNW